MATAIRRAGTILAIVTAVLVMVVCVILGARLVAGPDEPAESVERAQERPVCLSEVRGEAVEQRNQNQRVWRIVRQIQYRKKLTTPGTAFLPFKHPPKMPPNK
jgi:hypothetical protein